MAFIKILNRKPNNWDTLVHHPLQAWEWGDFRISMGIDVVRIGLFKTSTEGPTHEPFQVYQLTFHKLPALPFTIGYFPKGPLPDEEMLQTLRELGQHKKAIFIQLEPDSVVESNPIHFPTALKPSHHPLFTKYTFMIDLTKSEEELLQAMHSKTRYNIKVAMKHAVTIKEDPSPEAFGDYLKLNEETTRRQGFYAHTTTYHTKMWNILSKNGMAKLWKATYKDITLATWIIFNFKDTLYYPYGASSRENREVMAPSLMLWELIKWGKKKGYKNFDLWGAMELNPDIHDPWYGFHRFKEGFSPKHIQFIGSFDFVLYPVLYRLYCLVDSLRWKLLKMKR